ncbi:anaphase-promoting complex subunit 5-like isoform X2 [Mya arenaria]|uniref:anaphase-promoting complex subunit 5-like isoform X2 n=1 Tax=Mya arenaria TaxID=6604 RepID=UPI0022E492A6|nr:anaphase-promoting complex subunit 5-like isoform X2 [Mya arenaria]
MNFDVTPHKISLIVLIHEYCTIRRPSTVHSVFSEDSDSDINLTEREKRNFMVMILQLLQSSDLTLKELFMKIRDKTKIELYTLFLKRLQEFIEDGVGALKDYFQNVTKEYFLSGKGVERSSVLGLFIRRITLAFEKLSFTQVTDMYRKFERYYEAGVGSYEESQDFGGSLTDSAMSLSGVRFSRGLSLDPFQLTNERKLGDEGRAVNSFRQAEYFILQQAFLLQHNQKEALSPSDLQDKIMDMLEMNPDIAEAHFLSFLNSLRVKEYCTALHNLFHFFDRKTIATFNKGQGHGKHQPAEEVHRRYAALNLASLHYRFGHKEEALAPLQEAIGMAQDANDNVCLQHALGWLQRLSEQGTASTENLLERAVTKSSELNLPNLTSIGIQAFARHNAFAAAKPAQVFEYLQKSDVLNCQHSQSGFMCTSFANKAALWQMYGKMECMSMLSQLILHLDTSEHSVFYNGESICVAMCNLARFHAQMGQYGLALDIINCAKKRFPKNQIQSSEIWMETEQQILFDRTILNRKFGVTELAVLNLKALNPLESQLREAILNKEKGEVTESLNQLHLLLDNCGADKGNNSVTADFKCRVLLELGELYRQTSNPTSGTSYILECMTLAKSHHLEYLAALGSIQLAHIQLQMQLPEQALSLLSQHMLAILSHGTVTDRARLLTCHTKCQVAIATRKPDEQKRQGLLSCINTLNTAIELYQSAEAFLHLKDTVYLQTRLYHELDLPSERNKCARQFRQLDVQYPSLSQMTVNAL